MELKYTAKEISKIEFSGVEKGYEPLEVDKVLDEIMLDYQQLDKLIEEISLLKEQLSLKNESIISLEDKIKTLQNRIKELEDLKVEIETELSFQKTRVERALGTNRDTDSALDSLIYIKELENKLVELGGDPVEIRSKMYRRTIDITKIKK